MAAVIALLLAPSVFSLPVLIMSDKVEGPKGPSGNLEAIIPSPPCSLVSTYSIHNRNC